MQDGGRLIAISSQASLEKPKGLTPYVVSKSALNALMLLLSAELKERHIASNAILPSAMGPAGSGLVPIERVADTIAFLLSDAAANVTGSLISLLE